MENETVFSAKDPTRAVAIAGLLIAALAIALSWNELATGDGLYLGIIAAVILVPVGLGLLLARRAAKKKAILRDRSLVLASGSKEQSIDLAGVTLLLRRRVKMGKGSYMARFARLSDGQEVQLFQEGAFLEEPSLVALIEERSGRKWEEERG